MIHAVCLYLFFAEISLVKHIVMHLYLVSFSSFSIGLRFYYWKKYEHGKYIDHSGYKQCDLYIQQKHPSIKHEIKEYKYLSIHQYNYEIVPKAKIYHNTNYAKSIIAKGDQVWHGRRLYYGIKPGSALTLSHIVTVVLYTDYTNLCGDFSTTFRKINPFDTLEIIKQRNRKYWWMSKFLRETVEIFGECSFDQKLLGPFYSGLSMVINISNFFLRLSSPTSTSMHIEVAMKFSGDEGIILKLDNPTNNKQCYYLRGFDCSTISRYKEENERYVYLYSILMEENS